MPSLYIDTSIDGLRRVLAAVPYLVDVFDEVRENEGEPPPSRIPGVASVGGGTNYWTAIQDMYNVLQAEKIPAITACIDHDGDDVGVHAFHNGLTAFAQYAAWEPPIRSGILGELKVRVLSHRVMRSLGVVPAPHWIEPDPAWHPAGPNAALEHLRAVCHDARRFTPTVWWPTAASVDLAAWYVDPSDTTPKTGQAGIPAASRAQQEVARYTFMCRDLPGAFDYGCDHLVSIGAHDLASEVLYARTAMRVGAWADTWLYRAALGLPDPDDNTPGNSAREED